MSGREGQRGLSATGQRGEPARIPREAGRTRGFPQGVKGAGGEGRGARFHLLPLSQDRGRRQGWGPAAARSGVLGAGAFHRCFPRTKRIPGVWQWVRESWESAAAPCSFPSAGPAGSPLHSPRVAALPVPCPESKGRLGASSGKELFWLLVQHL